LHLCIPPLEMWPSFFSFLRFKKINRCVDLDLHYFFF
jgi:hypothetical protein